MQKHQKSVDQWNELQNEDYQYIQLADDVDQRLFYCLLAGIRGACIKYGATKNTY